jgi:D-3-phosphoglycerate dehydrogenase
MKALITAEFEPTFIDLLGQQMEVRRAGWGVTGHALSTEELILELKDKDILIAEIEKVDTQVINSCPRLRLIAVCRNHPINVDAGAARERGIPVIYTPGRNAQAVAEFTVCLMLMAARHIGRALRDVWAGRWTFGPVESYLNYKGYELAGRCVGSIGLGNIGRRVLRLCDAFGMSLCVYDPYLKQRPEWIADSAFVSLPELLQRADFVTLHCADTPETKGLIGRKQLALMKPTAFLINTARGKHVDEEALLEALTERRIAGAALDVFACEPLPLDHPFYRLDNLLITPHIAGSTWDVVAHQSEMIYADIQRWLRGEPLLYAWGGA